MAGGTSRFRCMALLGAVAALIGALPAGAGARRAAVEPVVGVWSYKGDVADLIGMQIEVKATTAGAFAGVVAKETSYTSPTCRKLGAQLWLMTGAGLKYTGTHAASSTSYPNCNLSLAYKATWTITESGSVYKLSMCFIGYDGGTYCWPFERTKPAAPAPSPTPSPAPATSDAAPDGTPFQAPVDILFAVDTSPSMAPSLADVRTSILGAADRVEGNKAKSVTGISTNVRYGVISFGPGGEAGSASIVESLTSGRAALERALSGLNAYGGEDAPAVDMAPALTRAAAGGTLAWRAGAERLVVVYSDAKPYGPSVDPLKGCTITKRSPGTGSIITTPLRTLHTQHVSLIFVTAPKTQAVSKLQPCYQRLGAQGWHVPSSGGEMNAASLYTRLRSDITAVLPPVVHGGPRVSTTLGGKALSVKYTLGLLFPDAPYGKVTQLRTREEVKIFAANSTHLLRKQSVPEHTTKPGSESTALVSTQGLPKGTVKVCVELVKASWPDDNPFNASSATALCANARI